MPINDDDSRELCEVYRQFLDVGIRFERLVERLTKPPPSRRDLPGQKHFDWDTKEER